MLRRPDLMIEGLAIAAWTIGARQVYLYLRGEFEVPWGDAQKRFCTTEGIDGVVTLSLVRGKNFAKDYGVLITEGPLAGMCSRAVVVLDENNKVVYTEQVPEIAQEPDYDKALAAI